MNAATKTGKAARIVNELGGRERRPIMAALMKPKMIFSLVIIGIFSFAALVTLSGYAGDMRQQNNGQAHALSRSAIGYGGLARLMGDMGYDVQMARTENVRREEENVLRVFTLSRVFQADKLDDLNINTPTLIILPKWNVLPVEGKAGWMQKGWGDETMDPEYHARDLKELTEDVTLKVNDSEDKSLTYDLTPYSENMAVLNGAEIEFLQTITGDNLDPIYETSRGPILVRLEDAPIYILSDPDLMNTMGIASKSRARFALDLIEEILVDADADTGRVDFDLTLHGFGGKNNIIKTLTQPPFLAATLCLLAAGLLIAWQAFSRFGDPLATPRDYALGKFSLADNAARFIRIAQREPNMADDYAGLVRRQLIKDLNLSGRKQADIDKILNRRETHFGLPQNWADLRARAVNITDNQGLMHLARDLDKWKDMMISGEKNEP